MTNGNDDPEGVRAVRAIFEVQGTARTLRAGELLFEEGSDPDAVYFVTTGELEATRLQAGSERRELAPKSRGTLMGEAAALAGTKRSVSARARGGAEVLVLPADAWLAALRADAAACFEVACSLAVIVQEVASE